MGEIILWDIMDTLVHDPFFTEVPAFFSLTLEELLEQKHPQSWREFEVGKIDEETLFKRFFRDHRSFDALALKRCWISAYRWLDGVVPLLESLRLLGIEMHALSNYTPWYHEMDRRLGISEYVRLSFISCDTGLRKPALEAYLGAAQSLQRHPSDLLFIDDRKENIEGAMAAGLQALHFKGDVGRLREQLTARRRLGFSNSNP